MLRSEELQQLKAHLRERNRSGVAVYPPPRHWFAAFDLTPFDSVRVVILGQDPYHGAGQAHGLSFSVPDGVRPPPSLENIFREITSDCGISPPRGGNLTHWARQGVLLLNTCLTVEAGSPAVHRGWGWERLTETALRALAEHREGLVFMLWGRFARDFARGLDGERHLVLEAAHPSPMSAHSGFFGCRHFSRANDHLIGQGLEPIDWSLPEVRSDGD